MIQRAVNDSNGGVRVTPWAWASCRRFCGKAELGTVRVVWVGGEGMWIGLAGGTG